MCNIREKSPRPRRNAEIVTLLYGRAATFHNVNYAKYLILI